MPTVSTKIPEDLKIRMKRLSHVNWSEVMRIALKKRIEEEEKDLIRRNQEKTQKSISIMDSLRRKTIGNSTEELRKWREIRH